jgi:hypothetical protein
MVLPSTQRLDELIATAALDARSPLPVKGNAVVYQYEWPTDLGIQIKREVFSRVCTKRLPKTGPLIKTFQAKEVKAAAKGATVASPKQKSVPVVLESGELTTGPNEIAILLPIKPPQALEQAELQTWREKGNSRSKTKLTPGLIVIFPSVCYIMPDDVPFVPYFCAISQPDSAELAKGSEE